MPICLVYSRKLCIIYHSFTVTSRIPSPISVNLYGTIFPCRNEDEIKKRQLFVKVL